jgi:hypothetical protein
LVFVIATAESAMRKMLLTAAGALALAGSAHAQEIQPNPYQSRDVPIGAFERVEVSGPFRVGVLIGDEPARVRLSGPPALLADTIAQVDGDTLTIRFREGARWSWNPGSGMNVVVFAPSLVSARVHGAAQVEIVGVRSQMFSAATDGSGTIVIRGLESERVQFATGGAGGITAEGFAREGAYATGGSGSIDARRLRVENASIAIGGSGSIYADVSRTANVSMGGSGRVDVVGGATCIGHPAGSSRFECR